MSPPPAPGAPAATPCGTDHGPQVRQSSNSAYCGPGSICFELTTQEEAMSTTTHSARPPAAAAAAGAATQGQAWAYPLLITLLATALGVSGAPAPLYGMYA